MAEPTSRRAAPASPTSGGRPARGALWWLVAAATLAAFALRVAGLTYGLPDHLYHSDTPKQLDRVADFLKGDLDPGNSYPVPHMYLVALLLGALFRLDPHTLGEGPTWSQVVIAARLLNAALGAAMVPLLYVAGRRLLDPRAAALAAVLLALDSVHIVHSHYEMGDIPQTFFVVASVAAAARALVTGSPVALLAAGALAGLAGSAKYYGILVLGAAIVAVLGQRSSTIRPAPSIRRTAGLLAGAGVAAAVAFAVGTPRLLLAPRAFLDDLGNASSGLAPVPPPPVLQRPWTAARILVATTLDWVDPWMAGAAVVGALLLLRRWPRGATVLVTPALVLAVYVAFRSNYLDDRNLVILVPFLALCAAHSLHWLAGLGRWPRRVATLAATALLISAAASATGAAYLFQLDDTRLLAERWEAHWLPPGSHVVRRLDTEATPPRSGRDDYLVTNTQDDLRLLAWSSPLRSPRAVDSYRGLSREGKLLQRIELLPRGFTAPTFEYFDLDSPAPGHVFPPPDDVEPFRDAVIFLDEDAVPSRAGAVFDRQPITLTLVSRGPLDHLDLALTGVGRAVVRQGPSTVRSRLDPVHPTVIRLTPWRTWPWFKHVYSLELRAPDGYAYARILKSPCEVAEVQAGSGQWDAAAASLRQCQGRRFIEPARLLDLARAEARRGKGAEARRALVDLERASPGLLRALGKLANQPDGDAWRERYRQLAGQDVGFWWRHVHRVRAAESGQQPGEIVGDAKAGAVVRLRSGAPAEVRLWLPAQFLRGRYVLRFRLRGRASGPAPLARLELAQLSQGRTLDVVQSREWTPTSADGGLTEIVVPVEIDREPVKLQARVLYHGQGVLDVDEVSITPDVRRSLAEKLAALGDLRAAGVAPLH